MDQMDADNKKHVTLNHYLSVDDDLLVSFAVLCLTTVSRKR